MQKKWGGGANMDNLLNEIKHLAQQGLEKSYFKG